MSTNVHVKDEEEEQVMIEEEVEEEREEEEVLDECGKEEEQHQDEEGCFKRIRDLEPLKQHLQQLQHVVLCSQQSADRDKVQSEYDELRAIVDLEEHRRTQDERFGSADGTKPPLRCTTCGDVMDKSGVKNCAACREKERTRRARYRGQSKRRRLTNGNDDDDDGDAECTHPMIAPMLNLGTGPTQKQSAKQTQQLTQERLDALRVNVAQQTALAISTHGASERGSERKETIVKDHVAQTERHEILESTKESSILQQHVAYQQHVHVQLEQISHVRTTMLAELVTTCCKAYQSVFDALPSTLDDMPDKIRVLVKEATRDGIEASSKAAREMMQLSINRRQRARLEAEAQLVEFDDVCNDMERLSRNGATSTAVSGRKRRNSESGCDNDVAFAYELVQMGGRLRRRSDDDDDNNGNGDDDPMAHGVPRARATDAYSACSNKLEREIAYLTRSAMQQLSDAALSTEQALLQSMPQIDLVRLRDSASGEIHWNHSLATAFVVSCRDGAYRRKTFEQCGLLPCSVLVPFAWYRETVDAPYRGPQRTSAAVRRAMADQRVDALALGHLVTQNVIVVMCQSSKVLECASSDRVLPYRDIVDKLPSSQWLHVPLAAFQGVEEFFMSHTYGEDLKSFLTQDAGLRVVELWRSSLDSDVAERLDEELTKAEQYRPKVNSDLLLAATKRLPWPMHIGGYSYPPYLQLLGTHNTRWLSDQIDGAAYGEMDRVLTAYYGPSHDAKLREPLVAKDYQFASFDIERHFGPLLKTKQRAKQQAAKGLGGGSKGSSGSKKQ